MTAQSDAPVACALCGAIFGPRGEPHAHLQGPYTLHLCAVCLERHRMVMTRRQPLQAERD